MIVSIHQPNFFPYMGIFEKIAASDVFVIMGNCQFEKNNYQNRFKVGDKWHTMSVISGNIPIVQKRYLRPVKDWERITNVYNKLHNFDDLISFDLWRTNSAIIVRACHMLGIKTKIVYDYPTELTKSERLVDLCKKYGATKYLAGSGGKKYLDKELFATYNIEVEFQDETKTDKRAFVQAV